MWFDTGRRKTLARLTMNGGDRAYEWAGGLSGGLGCCILWFDTVLRGLRTGSPRTGRGRWVDVDGEEGFVVAGVGGEEVAAGGEGGGAAGDAVGPVGAFVEVGARVFGVEVEGEDAEALGQVLGAALEGVAAVEVKDLVP